MSNAQFNTTYKSWDIISSRVYSSVNANLTFEAFGNANLQEKTNGNILVIADSTGNVSFTNTPICSVQPVYPSQLVNKQYADSLTNPIGSQGAQGFQGAQGNQGTQGPQGFQGNQGSQGSKGLDGLNGNPGPTGSQGTQGSQGFQGSQGSQGSQGALGPNGNPGSTGTKGGIGDKGAQGPQGFQGSIGPQGSQGSVGIQGTTGQSLILATDADNNLTFPTTTKVSLAASIGSVTSISGITITGDLTLTSGGNLNLSYGQGIYFLNASNVPYLFQHTSGANNSFALQDSISVPLSTASEPVLVYGSTNAIGTSILYYVASSERYKTNILPISDNDDILNVQPVYFNYKDASGNIQYPKRIGFIAEEIAENEFGNYFVVRKPTGEVDGINTELMIPLYASAMRLLKLRINDLEKVLQDLKDEMEAENLFYEQSISELEAQFQNQ
jgi:hypothetical protein